VVGGRGEGEKREIEREEDSPVTETVRETESPQSVGEDSTRPSSVQSAPTLTG